MTTIALGENKTGISGHARCAGAVGPAMREAVRRAAAERSPCLAIRDRDDGRVEVYRRIGGRRETVLLAGCRCGTCTLRTADRRFAARLPAADPEAFRLAALAALASAGY